MISASTHDQDIFSFYPDERPCNGFSEALDRYKELVPKLRLAGNYATFTISDVSAQQFILGRLNFHRNLLQVPPHLLQLLKWQ